jgi:endonuclease YncB( thermonuclease family)
MLVLPALPAPSPTFVAFGTVVSIHDGDTITVDVDLGYHVAAASVALRLHGYDAREVTGAGRFGGLSDREFLMSMIPPGSLITIQSLRTLRQSEARTFARYVARVWVGGLDVNHAMSSRLAALAAPLA